ncbi:MAG: hypothetical protein WCD20_20235 [Rhodomicrobium sp.]
MTDKRDTLTSLTMPSAEDIAAWNALSREQQLQRLREELSHPDCDKRSHRSMDEILADARDRVARKQHAPV